MSRVPMIPLPAGTYSVEMPQLGYGVYKIPDEQASAAVRAALDLGYRSIDTASLYENEGGVGQALADTDVARDDIFLTTKVWNDRQGYDQTLASFDESSRRLRQHTVDLFLIHWPCPQRGLFVDTWRALLRLRDEGRIRVAGVSNFGIAELQRLIDETGEAPAINQIELHPYLTQEPLRAFHAQHGIATEAWGPLARGGRLLTDRVVERIAAAHGRTPAQVVLRWHMESGHVAIPKSVTPARMAQNLDVFDFHLDGQEMAALDGLDRGERTGPDPEKMR
ncbi:MAG: aldo/keto reductase [Micrococcales bacterium]|nr:aldo/keto reductase [Micrococcales bacterium]